MALFRMLCIVKPCICSCSTVHPVSHQFFNCHGMSVARLERTTSIEDLPTHHVGWPMKLLFLFLLNSPRAHLNKLNYLRYTRSPSNDSCHSLSSPRVDEVLYKLPWLKFLEGLISEWSRIILLVSHDLVCGDLLIFHQASIVLIVNMGFLAISSDLVSSTISLVSTVLALGSIITSLVNTGQQRGRMESGAEEGVCPQNKRSTAISYFIRVSSWSDYTTQGWVCRPWPSISLCLML